MVSGYSEDEWANESQTMDSQIPLNHSQQSPSPEPEVRPLPGRRRQMERDRYRSKGLWSDVKTGRWLLAPGQLISLVPFCPDTIIVLYWRLDSSILASSFKLSLIAPSLYLIHHLLTIYGIISFAQVPNVFEHFILPSNKLEDGRYGKSWWDFAFLAHYVIFWTLWVLHAYWILSDGAYTYIYWYSVRQFVTVRVLRPMAKALGVKGKKIVRFTERTSHLSLPTSWSILKQKL